MRERSIRPLPLDDERPCAWFALCDRVATVMMGHPVLQEVPTCVRCAQRVLRADQ